MNNAYYNENDPYAAQWLRNLIAAGHIAPGDVDDRSIEDVRPDELTSYTQCHFFAGIGIWSYALRQAGWSDDRPIWTGSCPCQPFSAAGKRGGTDDERHLWPHWFWLIEQCRPRIIVGEQVASKDGLAWVELVQTDLEGADYTSGALDLCAAGFGAPHIRQRLYFVAHADDSRSQGRGRTELRERAGEFPIGASSPCGRMADADRRQRDRITTGEGCDPNGPTAGWDQGDGGAAGACEAGRMGLADSESAGRDTRTSTATKRGTELRTVGDTSGTSGSLIGAGPTNGHWRTADWLCCRDGKWRPVEPGTFPLAHGIAGRVGRLRAYGNGICAPQAIEFIRAVREVTGS